MYSSYSVYTPVSVIELFKKSYSEQSLIITRNSIDTLIKKLLILNKTYSKDLIENVLHFLVNEQYQKGDINTEEMNHLHLLITQRLDQVYDDFKSYPYGACCLLFL